MLKTACIHPQLLQALARCGHGDKILIADGNYPLASKTSGAELIYLGLRGGMPLVTDVLETILDAVCIEKAEVMLPDDGTTPEIFSAFHALLPDADFASLGRAPFYAACREGAVRLAVSTGEQRLYANILLTVAPAKA